MGYRHDPRSIAAAAVAEAAERGLAALTFRSVGRRLQVPDRTVVYYFPSKADLVGAVLAAVTTGMRDVLATAVGTGRLPPQALVDACWGALGGPGMAAGRRLYVEALGAAAAGVEPYQTAVASAVADWHGWLVAHLDVPAADRRAQAAAVLATLDGLLVLQVAGGEALAAAARSGMLQRCHRDG